MSENSDGDKKCSNGESHTYIIYITWFIFRIRYVRKFWWGQEMFWWGQEIFQKRYSGLSHSNMAKGTLVQREHWAERQHCQQVEKSRRHHYIYHIQVPKQEEEKLIIHILIFFSNDLDAYTTIHSTVFYTLFMRVNI